MIPRKAAKTQDIVVMYTERHLTSRQIGPIVGLSHAGVMKRLKAAGIGSSAGERVQTECSYCGRPFERSRSQWRRNARQYCGEQCYFASCENPAYRPWRQGQKIARQIVARYFPLETQHVVHHKDTDNSNNALSNLAVFACQADHMAYHHGVDLCVKPIWEGK